MHPRSRSMHRAQGLGASDGARGPSDLSGHGQQLREHEQSAQCARHKQAFLPLQTGAHGSRPSFP